MKPIETTRFSYSSLFTVSRLLRKQPKRIELTPHLRRRLENAFLEQEETDDPLHDSIALRRALEKMRLSEVMQSIRSSTCHYCHREDDLVSYTHRRVTAYVVQHRIHEKSEIACQGCARRRLLKSTAHSLVAGWWTITALRATPYAVFCNLHTVIRELSGAKVSWWQQTTDPTRGWLHRIRYAAQARRLT
ncbi:MAG: hypothetical protein WA952_01265 [Lewinella sp.]